MPQIGRYQLKRELGRGAFGVVWLAEDPAAGRHVAIKLLNRDRAGNPDLVARFEREAKIAGSLDHPNIVRVLDFGEHESNPYLVMELLDGADLNERLAASRPSPIAEALEIVRQIGAGLEAAHTRGIVHRDLKPSNVRITADGTVKLMDFGLAHLPNSTLTGLGDVLGTPAYMAPEQLRGDRVDGRADLYSLGVILYEMVAGRLPFDADSPHALRFQVLNHAPHPLARLAESPDRWLEPVILRLLERDPENRFPDVTAILAMLPARAAGESLPAATGAPAEEATSTISGADAPTEFETGAIGPTAPTVPLAVDPLLGRTLDGRYRIESVVGEGGMGNVYLGFDQKVRRQVVLKVPKAEMLSRPGFGARFLREIRSQIDLEHPYIVKVIDAGEVDGLAFAVLQYLLGGTLSDRIKKDPGLREPARVMGWLPAVAEALDFIHGEKFVHRDVKPANILFDKCGKAYLSDFGIARASTPEQGITQLGAVVGTIPYMPPEAGKDPDNPRPGSDQYSLAVTVYEVLTRHFPHEGAVGLNLLVEKMTKPPRPPRELLPALPEAVERALLRALSPEPADRFPSCSDFTRAFGEALAPPPTATSSASAAARPRSDSSAARTEIVFRALAGPQARPAGPGEVLLQPALPDEEERIDLAGFVLEHGLEGLVRGEGTPVRLVVRASPTLDDMLAAAFAGELLAGRELPSSSAAYAAYTALIREGFDPPDDVPLTVSIAGIFQAVRSDGDGDLQNPLTAREFAKRWAKMSGVLLEAMRKGKDPMKEPLFDATPEFARERLYLAKDQMLYRDDIARGERWKVRIPGGPAGAPALLLRQPESLLFKYWSRRDETASKEATPYYFLAVETGCGRWVFSVAPFRRVSLKPLWDRLQAAEEAVSPERARSDPWFDGRRFRHTLLDAPHGGTALEPERVLAIVKEWGRAEEIG